MSKIEILVTSAVALMSFASLASFLWGRRFGVKSGEKKVHRLNRLALQKLDLKRGEVVLLKTDDRMEPHDMKRICEGMKWGADAEDRRIFFLNLRAHEGVEVFDRTQMWRGGWVRKSDRDKLAEENVDLQEQISRLEQELEDCQADKDAEAMDFRPDFWVSADGSLTRLTDMTDGHLKNTVAKFNREPHKMWNHARAHDCADYTDLSKEMRRRGFTDEQLVRTSPISAAEKIEETIRGRKSLRPQGKKGPRFPRPY